MGEYNSIDKTQTTIDDALRIFYEAGSGCTRITRIDYRLDNYNDPYEKELDLMTVLVYLIAHKNGLFNRRIHYTDGEGITTSVRAMPDKDDHSARWGIEYYDKAQQKRTTQYGNARLELRALNRQGETVSYVVKEWRDMLQSITRRDYQAMLTDRASRLLQSR